MIDVYELIKEVEDKKMEQCVEPHYITYRVLQNLVLDKLNEELNKMSREKRIKHGRTINDRWITIIRDKQ